MVLGTGRRDGLLFLLRDSKTGIKERWSKQRVFPDSTIKLLYHVKFTLSRTFHKSGHGSCTFAESFVHNKDIDDNDEIYLNKHPVDKRLM